MNNIPFRLVKSTDTKVQQMEYSDGWLYFAVDTGKIYLDSNNQNKILMGGGGTSLFYAYDTSVEEKPGEIYILSLSTIENSKNLKIGDLIINEANGCFYKAAIINYDNDFVQCSLIAVSGSGSGGSGSGSDTLTISLDVKNISGRQYFIYGEPYYINVTPTAQLSAYVTLTYEIIGPNESRIYTEEVKSGDTSYYDIGSKLFEGLNDIRIYAKTDNDGETKLSYSSCQAVTMALKSNITDETIATVHSGQIEIYVTPVGVGIDKIISLFVDGVEDEDARQTVSKSGSRIAISIKGQSHGKHDISIQMHAIIGGNTISAPSLNYELAWSEEGNLTPIIWFKDLPEKVTNYSFAKISYMVYDPSYSEGREFEIDLRKEYKIYTQRTVSYNSAKMLVWNISDYSLGTNSYGISRSGIFRDFSFEVEADNTRDMKISTVGLYLNLDSIGRSNSELASNRSTWEYTNNLSPSKTFNVIMNDFNWYNNGWIEDEAGVSALRISNGASINIPLTDIMKTSSLDKSWTFEFQFKIRNVQNYKTLINTAGSGSDGVESTISSEYRENSFAEYYGGKVGFCFGPSDVFFSGGNTLPNVRYKENEMINCSIVIDKTDKIIYIYINGIMSKVVSCAIDSNFKIDSSYLTFKSNACDVDLYKVRVYQIALNHADIVHNYIADQRDILIYDANNITKDDENGNQTIDLSAVQTYNANNLDNPTMPYAILKVNDNNVTNDLLPYVKDGVVKCDVTFINSPLDAAYANGELDSVAAAAGMTVEDYYDMHVPSFKATQVEVDVQGTSSQGYPRRNYKLKFKKATNFVMHQGPYENISAEDDNNKVISRIKLDDPIGEKTVTWKADYMESSGTHNTGLASYVKTLYTKHPLEDYYDKDTIDNFEYLRTTIYGFPMMVFQEHADGSYEFIGKYNFNYDKSCENVTGMAYDQQHPVLTDKTMEEVCECWELCNNKGTRCAFTKVDFDEIVGEQIDSTTEQTYIDYSLTVLDDFEVRYNYYKDDIEDWIKSPGEDNNKKILEKYSNLKTVAAWLYNLQVDPAVGADNYFKGTLDTPYIINGVTYTEDSNEYRLAKFKAEFEDHFDLEYCTVYFIITELLICYDSRGKNMMLASWGPQEEGGEYIWYPLFYDIDTQLGIENSGVPLWDYNVRPSDNKIFSTSNSVLWNNFYTCFLPQIRATYAELRSGKNNRGKLDFETLNGYYDFNPSISGSYAMKGVRPYVVYNADEYFKYIAPAPGKQGYITTEGKIAYTDTYYYCAQGTRELQRELLLNNRFYFEDSILRGGSFDYNNINAMCQIRLNSNDADNTSDTTWGNEDYPNEYDTLNYLSLTPFLNANAGFYLDTTYSTSSVLADPGEDVNIYLPESEFDNIINIEKGNQGQLLYICGKEYISDFGDLSRYYLNEIDLTGANKITKLILGSDLENYKNNFFQKNAKIVFDTTDGYPLLQDINFSKLASFSSTLDFSHSEKLQIFRALDSGILGVDFADGVQLTTCYFPNTITSLKFIKAHELDTVLESIPYKDLSTNKWPEGLYIEGLTNRLSEEEFEDDVITNITNFYLVGGSLGINSYRLLSTLSKIKKKMIESSDENLIKSLNVYATELNWSPYSPVDPEEEFDGNINYYQLTDHYTFTDYVYSTDKQWTVDTLNGKVFIQNFEPSNSIITTLDLLDIFIDSYEGIIQGDYFHDSTGNNNTLPYLSGSIYVNNSSDNPISEVKIKNYYNKYYPDLKIYVNEVSEALTVNYIEVKDIETGEEYLWESQKYDLSSEDILNSIESSVAKTDYDFLGWSLNKDATEPDEKQPEEYTVQEILDLEETVDNVLNFYAVFKIHEYQITFKNFDGSSLNEADESIVLYVAAGENLYAPSGVVPYRDDSELGKYQTYDFKGYSLLSNNTGSVVDLSTMISSRDLIFYAHFEKITDVRTVIHEEYFQIKSTTYYSEAGKSWGDTSFNIDSGVILQLALPVKGKITIPAYFNNYPVLSVDMTFSGTIDNNDSGHIPGNGNDLTYVFFEEGTVIRKFDDYAFAYNENLIEVDYPESLRQLGDSCFKWCTKLTIPNNYIGNNIVRIGEYCYNASLLETASSLIEELSIGESVQEIGYFAFAYLRRGIKKLWIGSQSTPSSLNFDYTNNYGAGKIVFAANSSTPIEALYLYSNGKYSATDIQDNYCSGSVIVIDTTNS